MKMTKEDKVEAFRMRLEGCTLQEIGNRYGVTRAYIHQVLGCGITGRKYATACIYPGIARWMSENEMNGCQFNKKLGIFSRSSLLYDRLEGKTQFKVDEIKRILEMTGMTFEEAFC